jgi:hypothetical protein
MKQIIRELKRQAAGEKLEPEQLKGLIRAGYVYRNGDEHHLTDMGRNALAQAGAYPGEEPPGTEIVEAFGHPGITGTANYPRAVRRREVGVPARPAWLAERSIE